MDKDLRSKSEIQKLADKIGQAGVDGLNRWVLMESIARQLAAHLDTSLVKAERSGQVFRRALEREVTGQLNRVDRKNGKSPIFEECQKKAMEIVEAFSDGLYDQGSHLNNQQRADEATRKISNETNRKTTQEEGHESSVVSRRERHLAQSTNKFNWKGFWFGFWLMPTLSLLGFLLNIMTGDYFGAQELLSWPWWGYILFLLGNILIGYKYAFVTENTDPERNMSPWVKY